MTDILQSFAISASGMAAQGMRLRHVAENIANVDTPGYQRKVIDFRAVADGADGAGLVQPGPVRLDRREPERVFAPDHPLADETGHYDGSNVDLMIEIADAREAQRSYDANLRMFDQARQMASSLLDLLRR